jgi:ubiquinone/menaquinone biosynthesis C-methylase UbiE
MAENRFARTADLVAARQDERAAALAAQVQSFVQPAGDEYVLDVGCGAGALALALAPRVGAVVGVDPVPELLAKARERAPANATFVEGDGTSLDFQDSAFDLTGTLRTLHHIARPELVLAEMTRVTRPRGRLLVVDQLAPIDPLEALAVDRFERARDAGHARLLPEIDLRQLFEANGLVLLRSDRFVEERALDRYLDLAGCEGDERARVLALAPHGSDVYTASVGWYLLERRYS